MHVWRVQVRPSSSLRAAASGVRGAGRAGGADGSQRPEGSFHTASSCPAGVRLIVIGDSGERNGS